MQETSKPGDGEQHKRGIAFLEALESRHNHVLNELNELNVRIEGVLTQYLENRSLSAAKSFEAKMRSA